MPLEAIGDARIRGEIVATVEEIRPSNGAFEVVLGIAPATTGNEASQLANMLFGNCSLQPEVELVDVELPAGYEKSFAGPRFGIEGIRRITGVQGRALTCSALKPQGSRPRGPGRARWRVRAKRHRRDQGRPRDRRPGLRAFRAARVRVQRAVAGTNRETGGKTVYAPPSRAGRARSPSRRGSRRNAA
jgi:ribulose-bisphosphate carboxylase large chain